MTDEKEYPCPECGRILDDRWGTNPMTGQDERTFQCAGHDCWSCFEADEIIEPEPINAHLAQGETGA